MPFRPSGQSGFTLVELVAVLVLLGILSVVALPKIFDAGAIVERGYANEVVSALRYGQKLALAEGCDIRVRTSSSGVDIYRRASCDGSSAFSRAVTHPGKAESYSEAAPSDVVLSSATIVFDAMGRACSTSGTATDFSITVGSNSSIAVVGETGLIRTP